jgi:hypothetical protein
MGLLQELVAALESVDPAKAAQLRQELGQAGAPVEPPKPPTILDEVRIAGLDAAQLAVSEIPQLHEAPIVLGHVVKVVDELQRAVEDLQSRIQPAAVVEPDPAPAAPQTTDSPGGEQQPAPGAEQRVSDPAPAAQSPAPAQWPASESPLTADAGHKVA